VRGCAAPVQGNLADSRAARQIAAETKARLGGTLYADSLSAPDGPAPTYLALMRHNLATLLAALT
jgi:zinc/manganese transport system substrate-binding protein